MTQTPQKFNALPVERFASRDDAITRGMEEVERLTRQGYRAEASVYRVGSKWICRVVTPAVKVGAAA